MLNTCNRRKIGNGRKQRYYFVGRRSKAFEAIDEYVEEIQKKIDALRADGFDKVSDLKKQIAIAKENKNLSATQRDKIIENSKKELENAKKVEADNKEEIKKLIAEAESYLAAQLQKGLLRT